MVAAEVLEGPTNTTDTNGAPEPAPVHSMHRLISSVMDTESPRGNKSEPFSPGNITLDTTPFLPSGMVSYRSVQPYQPSENVSNPALQPGKNFTPSFFIGEVIPEPYIPERFQTSRSGEVEKNTSNRSNQKLVSSQSAFAIKKILPFLEHMKHAVSHSMGHGHQDHDQEFDHVAPVHEPSVEDEDSSTPKYAVSYEDQHSDRPSYLPHYHGYQNLHSTKPITFDNGHQFQQDTPGYPPHDPRGNVNNHHAYPGYSDHYNDHNGHFAFNGTSVPLRDHAEQYSGPFFSHDNHDYQQKDHLDHFSHHDADFVLPSPFYPPEPEYPSSHHKGVHYKVYQK